MASRQGCDPDHELALDDRDLLAVLGRPGHLAPHAAAGRACPLHRGEFGHKVFLAENRRGLITDYRVLDGNPVDAGHVSPSLTQHETTFGRVPALYAADRGFYTPANLKALAAAGVGTECVPQRGGKKTAARTAYEKSRRFKQGLCLRLQRGCGVRGWGRDGLGTGARGRGARARRAFVLTTRRIAASLADVPAGEDVDMPRAYRLSGTLDEEARVTLFATRLEEYGAVVMHAAEPREAVEAALAVQSAGCVVVAPDFPTELRPAGVDVVVDDGLQPAELDAVDGVLTTCAAACAETGTLALDGGPGQGRRAITLVPDLHVCVVRRDQVVQTVPELFDRLEPSGRGGRPIVLVSGPSATSDIELARVEGVHGPRRLVVVIAA